MSNSKGGGQLMNQNIPKTYTIRDNYYVYVCIVHDVFLKSSNGEGGWENTDVHSDVKIRMKP